MVRPAQVKALCDALVHDLRLVDDNTIQPTFRVPLSVETKSDAESSEAARVFVHVHVW